MTKPYNPFAVPESAPEPLPRSTRRLSFAEFIAVVISTIIMSGMSLGVLLVIVSGGLMVVQEVSSIDLELLWGGGFAIALAAAVFVTIEFARRASVAIRQPIVEPLSDEEASQ